MTHKMNLTRHTSVFSPLVITMLFTIILFLFLCHGQQSWAKDTLRESLIQMGAAKEGEVFFPGSVTTNASDSTHFAYLIKKQEKYHVNIDGKQGPARDSVVKGTPFFNPDGSRYIYIAFENKKARVVSNEKEQPLFDGIDRPLFSPGRYTACLSGKIRRKTDGCGGWADH